MPKDILALLSAEPKTMPSFVVGQTVRVISKIDVNMPECLDYWLNMKCIVLKVIPRGLCCREWCYELKHPDGHICEFKLEELDLRYRSRS